MRDLNQVLYVISGANGGGRRAGTKAWRDCAAGQAKRTSAVWTALPLLILESVPADFLVLPHQSAMLFDGAARAGMEAC